MHGRDEQDFLVRVGGTVLGSTLGLTASFVGVVALATGASAGLASRLPFYVLGMAAAFVIGVVVFEEEFVDGIRVILSATITAVGTFLLVTLAGEGVVYAIRFPRRVIASQLLFYFLAAGLVATGLGYWGVRHWQDIANYTSARRKAGL